jgi:hypothetical protein
MIFCLQESSTLSTICRKHAFSSPFSAASSAEKDHYSRAMTAMTTMTTITIMIITSCPEDLQTSVGLQQENAQDMDT